MFDHLRHCLFLVVELVETLRADVFHDAQFGGLKLVLKVIKMF